MGGVTAQPGNRTSGHVEMAVYAIGIYVSFLTWSVLQERLTRRPAESGGPFPYSAVLYTLQAGFATVTASIYLKLTEYLQLAGRPGSSSIMPPVSVLGPLAVTAVTMTMSDYFGFAALGSVDYVTYLLAKSSKLVPVMLVHVLFLQKSYPASKVAVVGAVTAGVAVFTVYNPTVGLKSAGGTADSVGGIGLLGLNLLFTGVTSAVQEQMIAANPNLRGPQLMVASNMAIVVLNMAYMLVYPVFARSTVGQSVGRAVGYHVQPDQVVDQLGDGIRFLLKWPEARRDVFGFAICGAIGQIFIYQMLIRFGSINLVMVTVTRKMMTMLLSIVLFGHSISTAQWTGVALVFGGISADGGLKYWEDQQKSNRVSTADANRVATADANLGSKPDRINDAKPNRGSKPVQSQTDGVKARRTGLKTRQSENVAMALI